MGGKLKVKGWYHPSATLRIIQGLNRFSEDLDFHLSVKDDQSALSPVIAKLCRNLALQGYTISDSMVNQKTVRSTFIKIERLLFECGLSPNEDEKLSIKLEVGANPPPGWKVERRIINTYFPFSLIHHDAPSFLSGKIHAILQRPYTKGRDFYDIIFLLSRWEGLQPNIPYLQNALIQTNYAGEAINQESWKSVISAYARSLNWGDIQDDVRPFLISSGDSDLMELPILLDLLH